MLKLLGFGDKASGSVELFPLNGESQSVEAINELLMRKGTIIMLTYVDTPILLKNDISRCSSRPHSERNRAVVS